MKLTSVHNDKVKYWYNLKNKKFRDQEHCFLIEGDHLINEAQKSNLIKETISIVDESADYLVTKEIMTKISDQKSISDAVAVVNFIPEKEIKGNILILDNLQDPGNLGTIIRSAVAFNFDTVVLSNTSVDVYNPKVIRASEGMIFNINIIRTDIINFLNNLDSSYLKITTEVTIGEDIKNIKYDKVALVIGNEGNGVSKEVSNICDKKVYINMNKKCESLNAGVSASILMYEVRGSYHE